jgi:hypothetical protein
MPQPRSGGSSSGGRRSTSGRSGTRRSSQSRASGSGARSGQSRSTRASGSSRSGASKARSSSTRSRSTRSTAQSTQAKARNAAEERLEVVAQRLRKLNERIIEAGKEAGETTLTNYEKALKGIASAVERGPGSSEVEWVSSLATAQAKFIRDVTNAWTSAARNMLK